MPKGAGGAGLRTPPNAPVWMHTFAREIEAWSENAKRGPVALSQYSRTALPLATEYPFSLVGITDGVGNKFAAISNGVAWYYLDGTAV